jgi:hypothetical protein
MVTEGQKELLRTNKISPKENYIELSNSDGNTIALICPYLSAKFV